MPLPLLPPVFAILRGLIADQTGIHFEDTDRDIFLAKVAPRAEEAGFQSLLDYYYFLRYDPGGLAELDLLLEHLVVQETYLFREIDQLRALVTRWIAPRVRAGRRLRIWSAACATGEEPLSLAMLLAEADLLSDVELVASDISRNALATARAGRYGRRSLRALDPGASYWRWLTRHPDGTVSVDAEVRKRVQWHRTNLASDAEVRALGSFDVILCRNVLIYFDDGTVRAVLNRLSLALRPGGSLLVSVTESLMRFGTSLACEEHDGVFFYRKVE